MTVMQKRPNETPKRDTAVVLIVEDDSTTREALASLLSGLGVDVVSADSASSALEYYRQAKPELIVSDIGLGEGGNGCELLERIREQESRDARSETPAIAITAFEGAQVMNAIAAAGFNHFLPKPVDLASLTELVQKTLARRD